MKIGINSTFSKWGTPCNATYGDCGCDNCEGSVQDVPSRLDDLSRYEAWLGRWPKTKAHNPQSFYGEGYWLREPTADEAVVMNALAFNHGAKAIVSWVWPTSDNLAGIHGRFASLVTASPVLDFVAGEAAQKVPVADLDLVDVAFWGKDGEILLSVVNGGYELVDGPVKVTLPEGRDVVGALGGRHPGPRPEAHDGLHGILGNLDSSTAISSLSRGKE